MTTQVSLGIAEREMVKATDSAEVDLGHELRTPLTAMLGFAELLAGGEGSQREREEWASVIASNTRVLLDLVNRVLHDARSDAKGDDAGGFVIEQCREIADLFRLQAVQKAVDISVEIAESAAEIDAAWQPADFRQVLINLVGNAVKFTDSGRVVIRLSKDNRDLVLSVIDTGRGVRPEEMDRIFERFEVAQANGMESWSGSGLGLAITKNICERHGGGISCESIVGKGSIFTARLPWRSANREKKVEPADSAGRDCRGKPLAGSRILLAEDSASSMRLLIQWLEKAGAEVTGVVNGREMMAMAVRREPFDLILSDIEMPEVDGIEAVDALRSKAIGTPIIALTASSGPELHRRLMAVGFDAVATKPASRDMLISLCAAWIERTGSRSSRAA